MPVRTSLLPVLPVFSLLALVACDGKAVVETQNHPPSAPRISLGPTDPHTGDDLVVVTLSPSDDPEGDAVTYGYLWLQNGLPREDLTTDTVPASETLRGDTWQVVVTPNDGEADGATAEARTTVLNSLPTVTVRLTPEAPVSGDDLTATATAEDADGDTTTVTYSWTRFGAPTDQTGATVPAEATERGDVWTVTAIASDGVGASEPASVGVTIEDAAPEVIGVELAPADPTVNDSILALVDSFDADQDAVSYSYRWFADGDVVQVGTSDTLEPGRVAKHQLVSVEVTPNDGLMDGAPFDSADITVQNSPPSGNTYIEPMGAIYESSTLTCYGYAYYDADGDPEAWTWRWTVNGVEVSSSQTLDGSAFSRGDRVGCTATPYDGEASGESISETPVEVLNTAPTLASVTLSTAAPTEADTLSVTPVAADDDGDSVSYQYAWYVNDVYVSSGITLPSTRFGKGDSVYAVVTPFDGFDYGAPLTSDVATVANTAPVLSSVTLTPDAPYTDDTLTASVSASDADGDTLEYHYAWYVDGAASGADSATLDGEVAFDRDQEVYVVITASDGDADSAALTSDTVSVQDSAPTAPGIELTPTDPDAGSDLTCSVVTESTDADGDLVTYSFGWDVDGAAYTAATDSALDSVVDGADVADDTMWTCSVTPDDGDTAGDAASASVVVGNGCSPAIDLGHGTSSIGLGTRAAWSANRTATFWAYQYGTNSTGAAFFNDEVTGSICPTWTIGPGTSATGNELLSVWHSSSSCGDATWHTPGIPNSVLTAGWAHIAVVVSGGTSTWYVNGVVEATYTTSSITPYPRNRSMSLGSTGGYGGYFKGSIDDLAWWNRALSASEVLSVMNDGPTSVSSTSLFGYWPMDEGSGTTFEDYSLNGATGDIGANTWTTRCK